MFENPRRGRQARNFTTRDSLNHCLQKVNCLLLPVKGGPFHTYFRQPYVDFLGVCSALSEQTTNVRPSRRIAHKKPVLKGGNRVREKIPPRLVLKQHPFELRQSNLLRFLLSLLQLSSYRLFAGFNPLSTTFLNNCFVLLIMEPSRGPVSNTLLFSLIALSFALCFVALVHVEIELHAHRKILQVLTQQRQECIHSLGAVNDKIKLIASVMLVFICSEILETVFRELNCLLHYRDYTDLRLRSFVRESNILPTCTIKSVTQFYWFR